MKIIVSDSDRSNLTVIAAMVEHGGFEPLPTPLPTEAARLLEKSEVPLVVSDLGSCTASGLAATAAVVGHFPSTRFLLTSGLHLCCWADRDLAQLRALPPHTTCFLPKPFTVESFLECVHCLLQGGGQRSNCDKHGLASRGA